MNRPQQRSKHSSATAADPSLWCPTAIPTSNPELRRARDAGLEIWHRSDLLAALIDQQASIAVAGSHGKTTTSTLITTLLIEADEDPTAIIGGIVPCLGSNGHAGHGRLLVAEADESDGSLVKFRPQLGLITNLELDHTDHYDGLDDLISTMRRFADWLRPGAGQPRLPHPQGTRPARCLVVCDQRRWRGFRSPAAPTGWRSLPRALLRKRRARWGLHAAPAWVAQPQQRSWSPGSLPDGRGFLSSGW